MAQPVMEPTRERSPLRPADPNVVPLVRPARKRPSWVLLGVVLVGAAALLGAIVFSSSTSQISIVVAARDLAPGEVIGATDLRVVEIGSTGEIRAIQSSQQSLVIGQAARGPIPAGTVLNTDLFVEAGTAVPAGFVVVGAQLEPGAAPLAALATGDAVDVIGVVKGAAAESSSASVITRASVWAVERAESSSSSAKTWVSLLVPVEFQTAVAQAAADGVLRLSLVGASS